MELLIRGAAAVLIAAGIPGLCLGVKALCRKLMDGGKGKRK